MVTRSKAKTATSHSPDEPLAAAAAILRKAKAGSIFSTIASIAPPQMAPITIVQPPVIQPTRPIRPWPPIRLNHFTYTLPAGSNYRGSPGRNFMVIVNFTTFGPATTMTLTAPTLPAGVTLLTHGIVFTANQSRQVGISFNVPFNQPLITNQVFNLHCSAFNGLSQTDIPIVLTIWSGFPMQHQLQSNWCWGAVSTSVDHYYNASSTVTQCQVVNNQLGRSDCCSNGSSSNCNVPGYLDKALTFVGRLDHWTGSTTAYNDVVTQINAFHPLGIRVAWSGGGAHFIVASGYESGNLVVIDDPIYGTSVVTYNTLKGTYQGSGNWTHSYFTKP
jgi:hypothetical protein